MKKKVIRLNENDIENLVKKIIKESEFGSETKGKSTSDIKKGFRDKSKDVTIGMMPQEREVLDDIMDTFTKFFKQPGNQNTGKFKTLLNKLYPEMKNIVGDSREEATATPGSVSGEKESFMNEALPRRERERKDTQYRRDSFDPYSRESELMSIFGPYKNDVPPNVIQYMRKNPTLLIKRLMNVYGEEKMLRYMGVDINQPPVEDVE